jgi:hypothetical protein
VPFIHLPNHICSQSLQNIELLFQMMKMTTFYRIIEEGAHQVGGSKMEICVFILAAHNFFLSEGEGEPPRSGPWTIPWRTKYEVLPTQV